MAGNSKTTAGQATTTSLGAFASVVAAGPSSRRVSKRKVAPASRDTGGAGKNSCFDYFTKLPNEIQTKIWTEALRKPSIHFMTVQRREIKDTNPQEWRIKLHPIPKSQDQSGFRRMAGIATVCPTAARAVRLATEEKHRLPFPALKWAGVDLRTDIVCFEFPRGRNDVHGNSLWNPINVFPFSEILDRNDAAAKLKGIRNIAVKWSRDMPPCHHHLTSISLFQCLCPNDEHANWKMCPEEFSGFLDLFENLERVYVILPYGRANDHTRTSQLFVDAFFSISLPDRQAVNFETFWDAKSPYVEIPTDRNLFDRLATDFIRRNRQRIPNSMDPIMGEEELNNLKTQTVTEMTRDGLQPPEFENRRYRMPLARRREIKFKTLLAGPK